MVFDQYKSKVCAVEEWCRDARHDKETEDQIDFPQLLCSLIYAEQKELSKSEAETQVETV